MASYKYWERFISIWNKNKKGNNAILGWSDPDKIPLYGVTKVLSSNYIPEPWWGNDGTTPLHSVVINYNPGKGYPAQLKSNIPYKTSYANNIVNSGILPINDKWHWNNRACPILSSLQRLGHNTGFPCLREHLSVELIPWRTPSVNTSYRNYLKTNIQEVYNNSICFAAQESHRIKNNKLKNVVILRMSENTTKGLLNQLKKIGQYSSSFKRGKTKSGKGCYFEFSLNSIPNVRFISIWGPKSRNNFPPSKDLDEIIKLI